MKLHFFGTSSGTEPLPGRHHTSFAIETNDGYYWFDAGETCAYNAHLMGVDLLRTRKVFISHSHMDHIGGLGNLFWYIRKLCTVTGKNACDVELYLPEPAVWEHTEAILRHTEGDFIKNWEIFPHKIEDGLLCDDGIRVSALHNGHLPANENGYRSFGFLIECEGKRIVYTGDTRGYSDYAALMPCDILITETGHHRMPDVAREVEAGGADIGTLLFTHHGPWTQASMEESLAAAKREFSGEVLAADDMTTFEF